MEKRGLYRGDALNARGTAIEEGIVLVTEANVGLDCAGIARTMRQRLGVKL